MVSAGSLFGEKKIAGPKGYRAYGIGDIHGRLDLLDELLEAVEDDIASRPQAKNVLVFLGDLIDRGPDSAQVIERLRNYAPDDVQIVFLMGNHEEVFLQVLEGDGRLLRDWLKFGGAECAASYGIDPGTLRRMKPRDGIDWLRAAVPAEHVEFLESFADTLSFGNYLFVHAGIRPGVSLSEQSQKDLRWIRNPFLSEERDHGFIVVHGHTISPQVDDCDNRIGLDTGAYRTGILTAIGIEGTQRWFLQTGGDIGRKTEEFGARKGASQPSQAGEQHGRR